VCWVGGMKGGWVAFFFVEEWGFWRPRGGGGGGGVGEGGGGGEWGGAVGEGGVGERERRCFGGRKGVFDWGG